MKVVALLLLALLLSGCASSGLYTMTDEWCAGHPGASPARCTRNPLHMADIQGHERGTPTDMCPGQYTYRLPEGTPLLCWGSRS